VEPAGFFGEWPAPAGGLDSRLDQSGLDENNPPTEPFAMLRKICPGRTVQSRVYVSSLGLYEAELNGRASVTTFHAGLDRLRPAHPLPAYDVTASCWRATMPWGHARQRLVSWSVEVGREAEQLRRSPALIVSSALVYADGRTEIIGTDESWKASTGPILLRSFISANITRAPREVRLESRLFMIITPGRECAFSRAHQGNARCPFWAAGAPDSKRSTDAILHTPSGDTVVDFARTWLAGCA